MPPITKHNYAQKAHKGDDSHQLALQHPKSHLSIDNLQKHNPVSTIIQKEKLRK